jgi:hypothetical protein
VKEILELSGKAVAAISFLGLMVSGIFEWGYFSIIGSEFLRFAAVSDYIANAVVWLPASTLSLLLGFAIDIIIRRTEHWQSEEQIIRAAADPVALKRARDRPYKLLMFAAILFAAIAVIFLPPPLQTPFYVFAVVVLWPRLVVYVFGHVNAPKIGGAGLFAAIFVPMILALAYFGGRAQANAALSTKSLPTTLQRSGMQEQRVLILRRFEKGLLVRDANERRIEFVRWEDIKTVGVDEAGVAMMSNFCSFFGLLCLPPQR